MAKNEVTRSTARLARLYQGNPTPDPEAVADARRALAEAMIEKAVREALAVAPPLTADQQARLRDCLGGAG